MKNKSQRFRTLIIHCQLSLVTYTNNGGCLRLHFLIVLNLEDTASAVLGLASQFDINALEITQVPTSGTCTLET